MMPSMNVVVLVWSYLKSRPLNTVLNVILLSLGIAVITLLLLLNRQFEEKITNNARGIDLVVGAKGSPLQLILCNIFHIDFPTGNISLPEAEKIARSRFVKKAIPLALGDSYRSYRIVGTTSDYAALYGGQIDAGTWHNEPLEVTIGSNVAKLAGLSPGDEFASAHGLSEGGHDHDEHHYVVKGILKPTYSVLDNLILTRVESIWEMHEEHGKDSTDSEPSLVDSVDQSILIPGIAANDSSKQITAMLIRYRSPMAAIQMPRTVNSQSSLQAASPAFESARLFSILGAGVDVLMAFGYVLVVISGLSIFIALYNSLKERKYDLAIMRSMGAGRPRLFISVLLEGGMLTLLGWVAGVLTGHGVVIILSMVLTEFNKTGISGWVFYQEEWIILVGSLLLGLLCALVPALQAYRTDISKVLAGN
jgi:putative ABC transport system permease protein